ncbi:ArdC-like ssDNA-binding domain-containing protein [Pseudonocardia nigra]|uniref:ArdC-like ssDNA-binding domain-containing protein n=1 Tax=Pseudonocardia nigra TaxID=1921578 RepID=UPI001C5E50CA|nr:ArdC-like ssDNA-binding domain-containing protein [Pseudonocardia nigra]
MPPAPRRQQSAARLTLEERAARVDALSQRLVTAVEELTTGEQWTAMLRSAAKFHSYSPRNMLLLWMQAQERGMTLSQVAGFNTWRKLGRTVRKGERGFAILAPIKRRITDEELVAHGADEGAEMAPGRRMYGVRVAHVFDLAQTDGQPLPQPPRPRWLTGDDAPGVWDALADLVAARGYALTRHPANGEEHGWTDHRRRMVSVRPDIAGAHAAEVLAHELGHVLADHGSRDISRAQKETEAESIAYVVMTACGLDSTASAVPYVAGWSRGDPEVIGAAAATVHRVAAEILGAVLPQRNDKTAAAGTQQNARRIGAAHRPTERAQPSLICSPATAAIALQR